MSGPYKRRDLSNCGTWRLRIANNSGILSVKHGDNVLGNHSNPHS